MVAKIKSGKSLIGALNYNENKVKNGKAELIAANGYVKNYDALTFQEKLFRLTDLADRNLRTKANTVHLSLNFDSSEKIERDRLIDIADAYMKRIGFERQPSLIYQHFDAGHPHIHIVATNIQANGQRIELNQIGKLKSEPARRSIEIDFGLVQADSRKKAFEHAEGSELKPVEYGEPDTKRAVSNIVTGITKSYRYTSLPELNAILNLYNVSADKGSKESVMFKHGGLHYWIIGNDGKRVGVPIKASSIYGKPTLKLLENRFKLNEYLRKPFKENLKAKVNSVLAKAVSMDQLKGNLQKDQVTLVIRQNTDGRIYGLSFIDHSARAIFNGSDLGKSYSVAAIMESLKSKQIGKSPAVQSPTNAGASLPVNDHLNRSAGFGLLEELLNPYDPNVTQPNQFGPNKKKKKRRKLNL